MLSSLRRHAKCHLTTLGYKFRRSFAVGLGPVPFVMIPEVSPSHVRVVMFFRFVMSLIVECKLYRPCRHCHLWRFHSIVRPSSNLEHQDRLQVHYALQLSSHLQSAYKPCSHYLTFLWQGQPTSSSASFFYPYVISSKTGTRTSKDGCFMFLRLCYFHRRLCFRGFIEGDDLVGISELAM